MTKESFCRREINKLVKKNKRTEVLPGNIYISISESGELCWWLCDKVINENECELTWFTYLKDDDMGEIPDPEKHKTIVHNGKVLCYSHNGRMNEKLPKTFSEYSFIEILRKKVHYINDTMLNLLFAAKRSKTENKTN